MEFCIFNSVDDVVSNNRSFGSEWLGMLLLSCDRDFDVLRKHFYLPEEYFFPFAQQCLILQLCFCILSSTLMHAEL